MSAAISVTPTAPGSFEVEIRQGGTVTHHRVTVPPGLRRQLGTHEADDTKLVAASFEWLLEREPASAILREFSLEVIGRYFPDYPTAIVKRLG